MRLLVVVNKAQIYPVNIRCGTHYTLTHITQLIKLGYHTASTRHHSRVNIAGAGHLNKLEEQHNRIRKLRSSDPVTAEHIWASKELLEVIEAMPHHELFIHSSEELMPRGLGS